MLELASKVRSAIYGVTKIIPVNLANISGFSEHAAKKDNQKRSGYWCQIFGQLTFVGSTTDMAGPEQKERHSCHSDPHCTESF